MRDSLQQPGGSPPVGHLYDIISYINHGMGSISCGAMFVACNQQVLHPDIGQPMIFSPNITYHISDQGPCGYRHIPVKLVTSGHISPYI